MSRRMQSPLEIELAKWPEPPGPDDTIELATMIAGQPWRVMVGQGDSFNNPENQHRLDFRNKTIYVKAMGVSNMLPKLIGMAHRMICVARTNDFQTAMTELISSSPLLQYVKIVT